MFTNDFQTFIDNCGVLNYHEIFELFQVAQGHSDGSSFFYRELASDDTHQANTRLFNTEMEIDLFYKDVSPLDSDMFDTVRGYLEN